MLGVGTGLDYHFPAMHGADIDQGQSDRSGTDPFHQCPHVWRQASPAAFRIEVPHLGMQCIARSPRIVGSQHQVEQRGDRNGIGA